MIKTTDKIIDYINKKGQASGHELARHLAITDRAVRKQLRTLFESGRVEKIGKPPRVFYVIAQKEYTLKNESGNFQSKETKARIAKLSVEDYKIVEDNFLYITPRGERLNGIEGFIRWCKDRSFNKEKKASEYVSIYKKYSKFRRNGLISGKKKIRDTFNKNLCLDDVFYADFYAWEVFGKTKLGQLLLYGKQSQNRKIISEITESVRLRLNNLIKEYKIEAVGFILPTVKREVQFMKVFEKELSVSYPTIKIEKAKADIITPQKTLSKLRERIDNAEYSIFVTDSRTFSNVLLIDDAVGSGATMNQTACKIKKAGIGEKVYGFAITGSIKGFDVISEI